jgi:hypothetical protein
MHFLSISASIKSPTCQQGIVPSVCCSPHYDEHQYMTTQPVWMCLHRQWWPNLLHICWDSSSIKETYFHLGRQHYKMLNYFTILLWLFVYYHTIASVFVQPGWTQCFFFGKLLHWKYVITFWLSPKFINPWLLLGGHSETAPTSAPSRMDDMWSGNSFLLGSSSLSNHGGWLSWFIYYLQTR